MRMILAVSVASLLATPVLAADPAGQTPPQMPMTRDTGVPVGDNQNSKVAGPEGPVLLEDFNLIEKLARFDRERIPERVVHARGTGAQGVFVASTDFSQHSKASLFGAPGKETPVFVRFSTVMNFRGSPEAARDPRGFAVKFYTDQGNWDLVGINEPIFFIRDAIKFPDFVHANKPSPVTDVQDPNRAFDFFSQVPESTHMLTQLYTDSIGMPASYRTMDGFGVNTFRLVNSKGEEIFAKFHWKSQQGIKGMTLEETEAADTNYATKDLYQNISTGNFPKWDLTVQMLTAKEVAALSYDGFDDTKVWTGVPEVKVGTMTLNNVPQNYFDYSEESAFCPCVMVPGIEASPDRMLQGRLFAYADTQRYRIGANYMQLPVNRPLVQVSNNNIDGTMQSAPRQGDVNYEPTTVAGNPAQESKFSYSQYAVTGMTQQKAIDKQDNFRQAGEFYRALSQHERDDLIKNLANDLGQVKSMQIKEAMVSHFYQADKDYGTRLGAAVGVDVKSIDNKMTSGQAGGMP
ncbi:MAG: katB [Rhodospirillales bacterium]|nr:katB [Rhodospirillales bacterium]